MKSIKVKNVKIASVSFAPRLKNIEALENEALKKSIGYIKYLNESVDVNAILPMRSKFRVDFTIEDTCSGFANGIRKCILDEIPIHSMTMENDSILTNDQYIISDVLQKNIELIPILQDGPSIEEMKKWTLSLDILNSTDEVVMVKSGDLEINAGGRKIPIESIMSPNITIIELHPAMYLKLRHVKIVTGVSKDDAAKFATVSNTRYCIDSKFVPLAHSSEDKNPGRSSMVDDITAFSIGYTTYRNVNDPKIIIFRCCDSLIERLGAFKKELKEVKTDTVITYFSNLLDIETRGEYKFFNFKNEAWTLVHMISQYCYRLDNNIPFVAPSIIHPSTSIGVVKIKHPNPLKIINDAISHLLIDVEIFRKAF